MLNGPLSTNGSDCNRWFANQAFGCKRMIQPTVEASDGNMCATQNMYSRPWLQGTRVRARIHAMPMATGKEIPATRLHTRKELNSACSSCGCPQALVQLSIPHTGAPTNTFAAVLKLMTSSRRMG